MDARPCSATVVRAAASAPCLQAQPDPKQPIQQQFSELQRRLGMTQANLRVCRCGRY